MTSPRWTRRAEARPDEILDAALEAFTEAGFDAARMEDIARRAGLSKGAVYLYFDSKAALLRGLIAREVEPLAARLAALADGGANDPAGAVRLVVAALTAFTSEARRVATPRLVLSVAGRFPDIAAYYRERVVDVAIAALGTLLRRGVESGAFRPVDPEDFAYALVGPIFMQAMRIHALGAPQPTEPFDVRAMRRIDLLMHGLAREPQPCAG